MKISKYSLLTACVTTILAIVTVLPARAATENRSGANGTPATRWNVQVDQVDPGNVDLDYSFQAAIYENLVHELQKTSQFQQVLRSGDRSVRETPNLLVLKTTAEHYTPGSETRRAVTTVTGATKLTVRSQLLTADGRVVLDRTVTGNVRFMGSNLRATHNLARNIAKAIKKTSLFDSAASTALQPLNKDKIAGPWEWHSLIRAGTR
jgi:hypothetical protein